MEYVVVGALIAGFIGFVWLQGAAQKGLNRAFQHKQHKMGQQLLRETLALTMPAMPVSAAMDAIIAELNVFDDPGTLKHRAYVTRVDTGSATIAHGNRMFTNWTVGILVTPLDSGKVKVLLTPVNAMEVDGVVQGARELGLVHERVKAAVAKLQHQMDGA